MTPRFRIPPTSSFICDACRLRASRGSRQKGGSSNVFSTRRWSSDAASTLKASSTPDIHPIPAAHSKQAYTRVSNRSLIRLHGPDVVHFLNGLLPCRLQPLGTDSSAPIFTAFLTAKGRVLHDVFIYPPTETNHEDPWYIDVDEYSASAVTSHLKKHKLRSKFKLERVDPKEAAVYYIWPTPGRDVQMSRWRIGGQDPRPLMGTRFVSFANDKSSSFEALRHLAVELSLRDYTVHRMITGHAEGPVELISGSALPQESNLDFSGGIDFHKGCYLGQELTIRTHHTGVVRKRILPCQIFAEGQEISDDQTVPIYEAAAAVSQPVAESNISKVRSSGGRAGRSTGKWLGGVGNIGLALCRLEMMTDLQLTAESAGHDPTDSFSITWEDGETESDGKTVARQVRVKPFVPDWLRSSLLAGITARSERSTRKRQEAEAEEEVDDD